MSKHALKIHQDHIFQQIHLFFGENLQTQMIIFSEERTFVLYVHTGASESNGCFNRKARKWETERNKVNTEPPLLKGYFFWEENVRARKQQFLDFVSSASFVELVTSLRVCYVIVLL